MDIKRVRIMGQRGTKNGYKAMVLIYLAGGMDSYNAVVPVDCNLYEGYQTIRGESALDADTLLRIPVSGQAIDGIS